MAPARTVGRAFFPLDEHLGLDGAGVTPRGQEALVRLAAWMSFEHACELLSCSRMFQQRGQIDVTEP